MQAHLIPDTYPDLIENFADELRRYRNLRGWSQKQLAEAINYSASLIAMIETGQRPPKMDFAHRADEALHANGALINLAKLINKCRFPDYVRPYVEAEATASKIQEWQPLLIPGLLQTPDFTRAFLRIDTLRFDAQQVDEIVRGRSERQAILDRPQPPYFWAVIGEEALYRPMGGPDVMAGQLRHLLDRAASPHVTVQVLPRSTGGHPGMNGGFIVLSFGPEDADLVYVENRVGYYVDKPAEVADYALTMDFLRAQAAPVETSAEMIAEALKEYE